MKDEIKKIIRLIKIEQKKYNESDNLIEQIQLLQIINQESKSLIQFVEIYLKKE
jgi:hypothetical protein